MLKEFKPTYLYVKTHNITGLKYFGKTTNDPYTYYGSGKYWLLHLKKHGYNISTEIVGYYTDKEECVNFAITFSNEINFIGAVDIHKKKIWANQVLENGIDGGATWYGPRPQEMIDKIASKNRGQKRSDDVREKCRQNGTKGKKRKKGEWVQSDETKRKLREANLGKKQSDETIEKRRQSLAGHIVTEETRQKISDGHKGKIVSEETKEKLRARIVSEETRQKIKDARKHQIFSDETREKLSGKVIVIDKQGKTYKITKEQYYSQTGNKNSWEWVAHNSKEAGIRKE